MNRLASISSRFVREPAPDVVLDEPAKPPRPTPAESERAAREFRRKQPLAVVGLRPATPNDRSLTLAAAFELLLAHDGTVEAGPHGTIVFRLPALVAGGFAERPLKDKLTAACHVLDSCRGLVRACIEAGEPLPNARPAIGGGVLEE